MPGTFSKTFHSVAANKTCADFLHPGLNCTEAFFKTTLRDAAIGSLKFYFPVMILPLLLKVKQWRSLKIWKEAFRDMLRCWLFGTSLNVFAFTLLCCFYNIFQRFWLSTLIWLPVSIGSVLVHTIPPALLRVEGQGLFNMYVEFLIRRSRSGFVKFLRESKISATTMFSVLHACIMFGFLKKATNNFWFTSFKIKDESSEGNLTRCQRLHAGSTCFRYFKQELKQTMKLAFGIAGLKVLPKLLPLFKTPWKMPKTIVKKFDWRLITFFFSMNGIFKCLFCILNRSTNLSTQFNCIASALVSGVSYAFYPRFIIFTMAMTNATESVYKCYEKKLKDSHQELPKVMKVINKIPILYLMFLICAGLGIQLRIMYPSLVSKLLFKISTLLTNGRADLVAEVFINTLMGLN